MAKIEKKKVGKKVSTKVEEPIITNDEVKASEDVIIPSEDKEVERVLPIIENEPVADNEPELVELENVDTLGNQDDSNDDTPEDENIEDIPEEGSPMLDEVVEEERVAEPWYIARGRRIHDYYYYN